MTAFSDAIGRSRAAAARATGATWRVLPRKVKRAGDRPEPDPSRPEFEVQAHLFAPDKLDGKVSDTTAFETARSPGIVGDALALVVWSVPTGCRIQQDDVVQETLPAPAVGRKFRIEKPPGGDATGHIRLDLKALGEG
ncbi:hypothetical protein BOSE62_130671 [Bosea sp. 62]|uniref:hypothetical protein n=1 Tax=unclassified Bosea (in: a-proteobacteria) TaxID=2653178 RepID=UPI001257C419|nr:MULTISPECIES: hypothetical protein [unclassified Bosea (in: a-proteobacteria)]CAD5255771.1 hypothetical protein BOSE7B_120691 [Bosea sp. 7B]CAD5274993.1 hypothetical protein BOSE21B_30221 [Bosea sp. 21B]CAD5276142.1 hypothetical protein BOSE46_30082 [Bosea sp. 46]VVT60040.1 hypothetical protein BOS5A_210831 [Bosea sp. EC-HK365B]VXB52729.1 hypothetical protein BOSE62_130671 [Bosea sp. 62]